MAKYVCISNGPYFKSEIHSYLTLVLILLTVFIRKMKPSTVHPAVFPTAQAFEAASRPGLSALISCSVYAYSV